MQITPVMYRLRLPLLMTVICLTVLTGCLGGSSPPVKYYVLSPAASEQPSTSDSDLAIEIATIHLPQYLDRPHLVTRSGDNRLKILQSHQWGGNLRKDMMRTLAINLSQLLDTSNVSIAPHRASSPGSYRVVIEILRFEKDIDEHVKLTAQWKITRGIDRKILATQITTLNSDQPAEKDNYDDVVAMMSAQFGQLATSIATTIQQLESSK